MTENRDNMTYEGTHQTAFGKLSNTDHSIYSRKISFE